MNDDQTSDLPSHATFYAAHATVNQLLVELMAHLVATATSDNLADAGLSMGRRLRNTIETFGHSVDPSRTDIAETLPELGEWDRFQAAEEVAFIFGDAVEALVAQIKRVDGE